MPRKKESVLLPGRLRGVDAKTQGHERGCRVRATREYTYVDELAAPVNSHYVAFKVVDDDDFPQGDYEVTFGGRTEKITKRGFQYYGR